MANVNAATVLSARDNLISIIENTLKWKFEDGSTDPDRVNKYGASLDMGSPIEDINFGESALYLDHIFNMEVNRTVDGKKDHQYKIIEVQYELLENITFTAMNSGDLATSKLVTKKPEISIIEISDPDDDALVVRAEIKVTFRDLRT